MLSHLHDGILELNPKWRVDALLSKQYEFYFVSFVDELYLDKSNPLKLLT